MIKLLGVLTASVLLSGCMSDLSFSYKCLQRQADSFDESQLEAYYNERKVYIKTHKPQTCKFNSLCQWLTFDFRWQVLELEMLSDKQSFPYHSGFYALSRDYSNKNCMRLPDFDNRFGDLEGNKFCISVVAIEKPTAKVVYETISEPQIHKSDTTIDFFKTTVTVNGKTFIEKYSGGFYGHGQYKNCLTKDKATMILTNDFR